MCPPSGLKLISKKKSRRNWVSKHVGNVDVLRLSIPMYHQRTAYVYTWIRWVECMEKRNVRPCVRGDRSLAWTTKWDQMVNRMSETRTSNGETFLKCQTMQTNTKSWTNAKSCDWDVLSFASCASRGDQTRGSVLKTSICLSIWNMHMIT